MKTAILETWMKQNRNDNLTEPQDSRKETSLYFHSVIEDFLCSFCFQAARGGLRHGLGAPDGFKKIDGKNRHSHKPVLIGEILKNGQFEIVSQTKGLVALEPWSKHTGPDKSCDWVIHQGTYKKTAWSQEPPGGSRNMASPWAAQKEIAQSGSKNGKVRRRAALGFAKRLEPKLLPLLLALREGSLFLLRTEARITANTV